MGRIEIPRWAVYAVIALWVVGMMIAGVGFALRVTSFAEPPPEIPIELR